jgi:hypothetical protein
MSAMAGYEVDVELERLHWVVEIGGRSHILDLVPGVLGTVALEVDGHLAGHLRKPAPQRPWVETTIDVDGQQVVIAVSWHRPVMHSDVFVGGRSIRSGRPIEVARSAAPRPASNYETWVGGLYRYRIPGRPALATRWMAIAGAISLLALAVIFIWMVRPSGVLVGAIALVAMVVLFFIWFASWTAVTTRVHLALLDRPELDDTRRVAWFTAALLGYPVLSVAVLVLAYGVARTLATS